MSTPSDDQAVHAVSSMFQEGSSPVHRSTHRFGHRSSGSAPIHRGRGVVVATRGGHTVFLDTHPDVADSTMNALSVVKVSLGSSPSQGSSSLTSTARKRCRTVGSLTSISTPAEGDTGTTESSEGRTVPGSVGVVRLQRFSFSAVELGTGPLMVLSFSHLFHVLIIFSFCLVFFGGCCSSFAAVYGADGAEDRGDTSKFDVPQCEYSDLGNV